ncbi:MAG: hypothetical protein ACQEUT_20040 [Bacillota bacterium]
MFTQDLTKEAASLVLIPNNEILQQIESYLSLSPACCLLSPNSQMTENLRGKGFRDVIEFSPDDEYLHIQDHYSKVIVFESHIVDTCDMMKVIKNSTCAPVIVITTVHGYPMRLYYSMGAKYVVYTRSSNISYFLR